MFKSLIAVAAGALLMSAAVARVTPYGCLARGCHQCNWRHRTQFRPLDHGGESEGDHPYGHGVC
jgi:hypothetical protein